MRERGAFPTVEKIFRSRRVGGLCEQFEPSTGGETLCVSFTEAQLTLLTITLGWVTAGAVLGAFIGAGVGVATAARNRKAKTTSTCTDHKTDSKDAPRDRNRNRIPRRALRNTE